MGDTYRTIRVAAVQAAPVFLDREKTVDKACALIREAGAAGAQLIGFPEGFIPSHPLWFHFHAASSGKALQLSRDLARNAVEIPGPATEDLCKAARDARIHVVMGLCEKTPGRVGTLYNTLLFIDDQGRILGRHRKLHPTLGERIVHTPGDAEGLKAYPADFGPFSGLMCGENSNALSTFSLDAQGTTVHVMSWPAHFGVSGMTTTMADAVEIASRAMAYQTKAFVINSVGAISDAMREAMPLTDEHRQFLTRHHAGASVVAPGGKFIAGPMGPGEGILYADINLADAIIPKISQDFSGHYNRFDIFSLSVKVEAHRPLTRLEGHTAPEPADDRALVEPLPKRELPGARPPALTFEQKKNGA
jgi:nitrilase